MTAARASLPLGRAAVLFAALFALEPAARAADFQIDGLRLDFGSVVATAPTLAVKGSPLEREAFVALFGANAGESAVARLGRFSAEEISAPSLVLEQRLGPQTQVTTYRGVRLAGVREGRIAKGEATGGTIGVSGGPTEPMKGEMGATRLDELDLRQIARVLTETAAGGSEEPMRPLLGRFEQDGYTLDMGKAGTMSFGRSSGRGFAARVGSEPLADVIARATALSALEKDKTGDGRPDDPALREAQARLGLSVLGLFDNVSFGSGEVRDVAMTVVEPAASGGAGGAVTAKIARLAYGEDTPDRSGFALEGFSLSGAGASGSIGSMSHSGFSLGPVVKELRAAFSAPDGGATAFDDVRKLIPVIGTLRLKGIGIEAPPAVPGGQPVRVSLAGFELAAGEPLNGIPTSLVLSIDGLSAPIVESAGNPAARDLIAMGIRSLDLSAKLDLAWDAGRNEIAVKSLSLSGADLARFDASATLGNVTRDLFSSDAALAQVAALGATARRLDLSLQNFGLIEKIIANEARKAGRKPEEMRQQYAMMASLGLAAVLGPSEAGKTLSAALSRFVARPGTLTIQARAKAESGLGLADVITLTNPVEILDKLDLRADAR